MDTSSSTPLDALRQVLKARNLDGWIMPISDPHLSEQVPDHWQSVRWLTGFTGSNAVVCVTEKKAALFTDSRYWIQAEEQLKNTPFQLIKSNGVNTRTPIDWMCSETGKKANIGLAKSLWSVGQIHEFERILLNKPNHSRTLQLVDDVVDLAWTESRPSKPLNVIKPLPGGLGKIETKLNRLRCALDKEKVEAVCLSSLADIAWLLNCRGSDIPNNPVFFSHMLVTKNEAHLYIEPIKLGSSLLTALESHGIQVHRPTYFEQDLRKKAKSHKFIFDPNCQSFAIYEQIYDLPHKKGQAPVLKLKQKKSQDEYRGIRMAMEHDGIALLEFYAELEQRLTNGETVTELDVVQMVDYQRAKCPEFLDNSFQTIAAFGPHAALPHYSPTPETTLPLKDGLLLVDSGGHYLTGTTDITRMSGIGQVSQAMINDVTTVLKGMIALATCIVPVGTSGSQLDTIARQPLWAEGLDFLHGTGHGVGYCLNVHEGPFYISRYATATGTDGLQKHQLVSDEPGVYRKDQWGVRIENLIFSKETLKKSPFDEFLKFEVMTLCPIDTRILNVERLTVKEIDWLNHYHAHVKKVLTNTVLSPRARRWLEERTKPIAKYN